MADWGMGATSNKHSVMPKKTEPITLYGPYTCVKCQKVYMPRRVYYGDFICPECEKAEASHIPCQPPKKMQVMIDDILNTKK